MEENKTGLVRNMQESLLGLVGKLNDGKKVTILVALMGVLTALCIVFERTVYIPVGDTSRYSMVFIMVAISSITLGAIAGGVVAALADIIGGMMVYGNICPLITVVVFLSAFTFGVFLYSKRSIVRIVLAVLVDQIICSLILKTGALAIWYYGGMGSYFKVFATRILQVAIMIPVEIIVLIALEKIVIKYLKKMLKEQFD